MHNALAKNHINGPPYARNTYGTHDNDPAVQQIRHIALQMGRVIGFSNVFYSKLEPFGVADVARLSGSTQIHMINPNRRKMGTSMLLNQRHD